MPNYNKVMLMGNLARDPELTYTSGGTALCKLGLAINREWMPKDGGEKKKEVCFVNITVWAKQAENCAKYLSKGRPIFVEGRLQSSSWETEGGEKRNKLEVVADRVQFLGGKPKAQEEGGQAAAGEEEQAAPSDAEDDVPF